MHADTNGRPEPSWVRWTGWVVSGVPAALMLLDGVMKVVKPAPVVEATTKIGFSESVITPLGIVLLIATVLYLVPRTGAVGAILLTGYLGGAVCVHVRANEGLFSILFPVVFGVFFWTGLVLRDRRLRCVLPWHA